MCCDPGEPPPHPGSSWIMCFPLCSSLPKICSLRDSHIGELILHFLILQAMYKHAKQPIVVVRGDFHQASFGEFMHDAVGTQCSTISLMAVIGASVKSHSNWTTADINDIMLQGDREHRMVLKSLGWPTTRSNGMLDIDEFPSTMMFNLRGLDLKASIGITSDISYCLTSDLRKVMTSTFQEKPDHHFMLRMQDKCTAILLSEETGKYSIFDSHARDEKGDITPDGTACLMHFGTVNDLISYLEKLTTGKSDSQMDIIPVDIQIMWNDNSDDDQGDDVPIVICEISDESDDAVQQITESLPSSGE